MNVRIAGGKPSYSHVVTVSGSFWSAANGYRQTDPVATEQLYREIAPTFLEDKEMVEAQQRRLDELGEQGLVDIATDANRMHMRRIVEQLIVAEQSTAAVQ
jgi:phenylpropionate dioxygenase-like ring-hydroxylating dioxygenase large terminal subunit